MKKKYFTVAAIIAFAGSILFSSCIGPFALSNKLLAWNQNIDNKFVNAIIFVVLTPVYGLTLAGDAIIFNSIEFWTGNNPLEVGVVKKVQGKDGIYTVETLENGYHIENEAGEEMQLIYDKATNIWSAVADGKSTKVIKIESDKKALVYLPNGTEMNVDLTAEGVLALQQAVDDTAFVAAK